MKESISFKTEMFFAKNWKYIFWGLILAILIIAYELSTISNRMLTLENVVRENNSKVVLTTADGRAIRVTKTPLKAEYLKKFAVSVFVNNFIVTRANLTDEFKFDKFVKYSDILENSKKLGGVWKNFINQNSAQAKGEFVSYIQWIINAIVTDQLPEYIAVKDYSIDTYEYDENKYHIIIDIQVSTLSYILSLGQYVTSKGTVKIEARGEFSFVNSNDNNPYGMKINSFRIDMVTKANQ